MGTDTTEETGLASLRGKPERVGNGVYSRPRVPPSRRRAQLLAVGLVILIAIAATHLASVYMGNDSLLVVRVERQQPVTVDLRSGTPSSPYVFGVNVFPAEGTQATDGAYGFMTYDRATTTGLASAHITMLRFPGGSWGEQHTASFPQINDFLSLAQQLHAAPMMQVRLIGSTPAQAAALVSYCNNLHDPQRKPYPHAPFVPVHYWVIGNEPDQIGNGYTVADYARDFIAFSAAMKAVDPTILIFGPEISQYNGPDAPPVDATGTPWLAGFLSRIASYERKTHSQILSGVTIHRYPFVSSMDSSSLLFASADEWQYVIPLLREQIRTIMGTNLPIGVTELNTSPLGSATATPLASALWWADSLGQLREQQVDFVDFFAARGLQHPYSLLSAQGDATPLLRAMQLYAYMAPDVIATDSGGAPVSVFAATDRQWNTLTLMLVNKSAIGANVTIDPTQMFSTWHATHFTLPPYAIACLVLRRGLSGRAYVYAPSSQVLATGGAGVISLVQLG